MIYKSVCWRKHFYVIFLIFTFFFAIINTLILFHIRKIKMTEKQSNPTPSDDEQIWDELLTSQDGKMVLDYLLTNADFEIKTGQIKEDK